MTAKSAPLVVVLAMNVIGHRPAERHKPGTRRDRQKPSMRRTVINNLVQHHAGFGGQKSNLGIKTDDVFLAAHVSQHTKAVVTAIAVGSTIAKGQQAHLVCPINGIDRHGTIDGVAMCAVEPTKTVIVISQGKMPQR